MGKILFIFWISEIFPYFCEIDKRTLAMSKLEHTHPLMSKSTNIYKLGGVKFASLDSSCKTNPSTHTYGRLLARAVLKVAFVVSILILSVACQKATLISSDVSEETTRGTDEEAPQDSTIVKPEFDIDGWGEGIDANFTFGGKEKE